MTVEQAIAWAIRAQVLGFSLVMARMDMSPAAALAWASLVWMLWRAADDIEG